MPYPASALDIGREFDRFLFAAIGEDRHGQRLSVLSALARSDLDPWEEAADLADMPRKMANARLTALIAALPGEPIAMAPVDAIAGELIALLPRANNQAPPLPRGLPRALRSENARAGVGLTALAMLVALALMVSAFHPPEPRQSADPAASSEKLSTSLPPVAPR